MNFLVNDGLSLLNLSLAAFDAIIGAALIVMLLRRIRVHPHQELDGKVNGMVGTAVLAFYLALGVVTAAGPFLLGSLVVLQVLAVMLRTGITLILLAWALYTLDVRVHAKNPKLAQRIERWLHIGLVRT